MRQQGRATHCAKNFRLAVQPVKQDQAMHLAHSIAAQWSRIIALILFAGLIGCEEKSIVGKWRMTNNANSPTWEFSRNGTVWQGEERGKYSFGDNQRIKIETRFATSVYQFNVAGDSLVLQERNGSKLEFTRVK
jgi:hypothetical protein